MRYKVVKGDTLLVIAKKYNTSLTGLMQLNHIVNPNLISVGQELLIPEGGEILPLGVHALTKENVQNKIDVFLNFLEGKKLKKQLTTDSKKNIINLFHTCLDHHVTDLREVAYLFATIHWETNKTYTPLEEYGRGKNREYGVPYKGTGKVYYGRGYIQLTWFINYKKFTKILYRLGHEVDLMANPELACRADIAALIAVIGMRDGNFTSHCLEDFFSPNQSDWYNARTIINGHDRAPIIKDIAMEIYYIIK